MKPYIEYNNKKYEFEANFSLRKEFNEAIQRRYTKLIQNKEVTQDDLENLEEIKSYVNSHTTITEEELVANEDLQNKIVKYTPLLSKINPMDIYEEYCYRALNIKYGISKEEWEEIKEGIYNEYCNSFEDYDRIINSIVEQVFTMKAENKTKKTLPSWVK